MKIKLLLTTFLLVIFGWIHPVFAFSPESMVIQVLDSRNLNVESTFYPFGEVFKESFDMAVGDVNGDLTDEIVVGSAMGSQPLVYIYNKDGKLLQSFMAFPDIFTGGVNVALCDLDSNGKKDIITGVASGNVSKVSVFNYKGDGVVNKGFLAFDSKYTGGVRLACGDVDGNLLNEIVASNTVKSIPQIKIFNRFGEFSGKEFKIKGMDNYTGIDLSILTDDGLTQKIVVTGLYNNEPNVKIFDIEGNQINSFLAYGQSFHGGVNISTLNLGINNNEVLTGAGITGGPHVRVFDDKGIIKKEFFAFEDTFRGGVDVLGGDVDGDGIIEYVIKPNAFPKKLGVPYKLIEVNLKDQKLLAYDHGFLVGEYLISSGKKYFPTPTGDFTIYKKRPSVNMSWFYGTDNPNNYSLPNVPWVLSFKGSYTIHGTYWHHNFGHPMSHGCVNMYTPDVAWLYNWAPVNTPVSIHE